MSYAPQLKPFSKDMTTSIRLLIFTVACVILSNCSQTNAVSGDDHDWPMPQYEKVVGYCFEIPVIESNSLIQSEHFDSPKLARYKIAEVRLNAADVKRLIDAIYKPKIIYPVSSCHNPHHVFVFMTMKVQRSQQLKFVLNALILFFIESNPR
jgi:hypothetical protein